jgi:hypothetical protein
MQFSQIGGVVAVRPGPKNSRIFFGQVLVKHSDGHIFRHIYANFQANLRHRFQSSQATFSRDPEMQS